MAITTKGLVIIPEILTDAIAGNIAAGMTVMGNTGAAIVNTNATFGEGDIGNTVDVPYFAALGEFEENVADGDALSIATHGSTKQQATVKRCGKAFQMTDWAATGASDPYADAARQLVGGLARQVDKLLIDAALATDAPMTLNRYADVADVPAGTTNFPLSYDVFTDARQLFGDEQMDIAALVVRSEVLSKMRKLRDGENRPLLVEANANQLPIFQGVPVFVTDRLTTVTGTNSPKYRSLLVKKNSLSAWINGSSTVETDRDILKAANVAAVNFYIAVHKYTRLPALSKGGVVIIEHNLNGGSINQL